MDGRKFRRQHQLGKYIVDFVCLSSRLIIEVDGDGHGSDAQEALDAQRTADLERLGFRVMRFWNNDVLTDIDSVAEMIYRELSGGSPPSPQPSPRRGEGDSPKGNLKIGAGMAPRRGLNWPQPDKPGAVTSAQG